MAPVQEVIVVAQDKREEETSMLLGLTSLAERGGGGEGNLPQSHNFSQQSWVLLTVYWHQSFCANLIYNHRQNSRGQLGVN